MLLQSYSFKWHRKGVTLWLVKRNTTRIHQSFCLSRRYIYILLLMFSISDLPLNSFALTFTLCISYTSRPHCLLAKQTNTNTVGMDAVSYSLHRESQRRKRRKCHANCVRWIIQFTMDFLFVHIQNATFDSWCLPERCYTTTHFSVTANFIFQMADCSIILRLLLLRWIVLFDDNFNWLK